MISIARAKERNTQPKHNKTHSANKHSERERERERTIQTPRRSASIAIGDWDRDLADRNRTDRDRDLTIVILPSFVWIWWFFSGFCLCFEEWMILCIRLVTEKMWENVRATSRKCVFYGIFKNTTKHQKIFSENFFEMHPNTWKHFLFRKIDRKSVV